MHIVETILIAFGLGADAMSISAAVGVKWHGPRQKFRLAWHMGLFQFMMPLIGYALGEGLAEIKCVSSYGKYIAGGLVFVIGLKMLIESLKPEKNPEVKDADPPVDSGKNGDPTRGWSLVVLSVATSLDALAIGASMGIWPEPTAHPIWSSSIIIGLTAAAMSLTGVFLGQYIGKALGRYAELTGALVLMGLGVSFFFY